MSETSFLDETIKHLCGEKSGKAKRKTVIDR